MKLAYLYLPVADLDEAVAFHRDRLGLEEAWREGDEAVALWLPDRSAQIMVATDGLPAGPMYEVDEVDSWVAAHADIDVAVERFEIPGGAVVGLAGPGGHVFYVFDMAAS
jgi:catechol 2,3-dioxygenase-like lactoylglutathione lyase family enzyme